MEASRGTMEEAECSLTARTPRQIVVKQFTSNALISQQHLGAGSSGGMEPADPACVPAARSLLKPPGAYQDLRSSDWRYSVQDQSGHRASATRPTSAPTHRSVVAEYQHHDLLKESLCDYRRPSFKALMPPRNPKSAKLPDFHTHQHDLHMRAQNSNADGADGRAMLAAVKEAASPIAAPARHYQQPASQAPSRPTSAGISRTPSGSRRPAGEGAQAAGAGVVRLASPTIQVKQPVLSPAVMAQHQLNLAQRVEFGGAIRSAPPQRPPSAGRPPSAVYAGDRRISGGVVGRDAAAHGAGGGGSGHEANQRPSSHSSSSASGPDVGGSKGRANASGSGQKPARDEGGQRPADAAPCVAVAKTGGGAGAGGAARAAPARTPSPAAHAPAPAPAAKAWAGMGVEQVRGRLEVGGGVRSRPVSAAPRFSAVQRDPSAEWTAPAMIGGRQPVSEVTRVGGSRPATASVVGRRRPKISDLM